MVKFGALASVLAAAVIFVARTDVLQRLTEPTESAVRVDGFVSQELLDLARSGLITVQLGSGSETVKDGTFSVSGMSEKTGLATLVVDGVVFGASLVPKSSSIAFLSEAGAELSLETTAATLVLLSPEITDFYVIGNPVLDAAAQELLMKSQELVDLAAALRSEKDDQGVTFLDDLSPETENLVVATADWFRSQVSRGSSSRLGMAAAGSRPVMKGASTAPALDETSPLPQSCDEGLMPDSGGEADGVCLEVTSPSREKWEQFDFNGNVEIALENLSPRAVALFLESSTMSPEFVGFVPPLDLTLPSVSEVLLKVFDGATRMFNLNPGVKVDAATASGNPFVLKGSGRDSKLTTVTFDWPGAPGVQNPDFDQIVSASGIDGARSLSLGLTALSTYLLPLLGVALDIGKVTTRGDALLPSCDASFSSELLKLSVDELVLDGSGPSLEEILEVEGAIPQLFWFVVLTSWVSGDCERAVANTKVIVGCWPTIGSFFAALSSIVDDDPKFQSCFGDFRASLLDRIVLGAFKQLVSPLQRADTTLVVLGVARSAAWSLSDAKRFADGDQYPLSSITNSRWCYEVAASTTRIMGVFGNSSAWESPDGILETTRELVQRMTLITRQIVEVGGNVSRQSTWRAEADAWETIATLTPPSGQLAAQQVEADAEQLAALLREIERLFPKVESLIEGAVALQLTSSNAGLYVRQRAKLIADAARVGLSVQQLTKKVDAIVEPLERLDAEWQNCPQSRRSS